MVTFDLDNTLWRTGEVISAANDALAYYLGEKGIATPVRTEAVMGDLFKNDKVRYCPDLRVEVTDIEQVTNVDRNSKSDAAGESTIFIQAGSKKPVLLTQLRKDALRNILMIHNYYDETSATIFAEEAFVVWTDARHKAIPKNYATSVLEVMDSISSLRTSLGHMPVVGAITDGNSDPRTVPGLGKYFDFVVNAELVGVSKPDKRVYHAAISKISEHPALEDLFLETMGSFGADRKFNLELAEDVIGPWWCHIGDDFFKDCVAAKDLKVSLTLHFCSWVV